MFIAEKRKQVIFHLFSANILKFPKIIYDDFLSYMRNWRHSVADIVDSATMLNFDFDPKSYANFCVIIYVNAQNSDREITKNRISNIAKT